MATDNGVDSVQVVVTNCNGGDCGPTEEDVLSVTDAIRLGSGGECGRSVVSFASGSTLQQRSTLGSSVLAQRSLQRPRWKSVGSSCLWDACRATAVGLLCLISGCAIVLVGFYAEFETTETVAVNQTLHVVDQPADRRVNFSRSYFGPFLIGVGVFVLIAVAVATMEMRDMTVKVYPLTKVHSAHRKRRKEAKKTISQALTSLLPAAPPPSASSSTNRLAPRQLLTDLFSKHIAEEISNIKASRGLTDLLVESVKHAGTQTVGRVRRHHRHQPERPSSLPLSGISKRSFVRLPNERTSRPRCCRLLSSARPHLQPHRRRQQRRPFPLLIRSASCPDPLTVIITSS